MFFGPKVEQVTPADAADAARRGELIIVDVRQPAEWRSGVPKGAKLVSLGQLGSQIDKLPAGKIAFVCASGHRSNVAARRARKAGREVVNVRGGMRAWVAAGLPTKQPR